MHFADAAELLLHFIALPPLCVTLQVEYYSHGVDDFALYLPPNIVPSKRVLLLRFRNRFDTLLQSLTMRGLNVTSAYPVTWLRKEWNDADYRNARNSEGQSATDTFPLASLLIIMLVSVVHSPT